MSVVLGETVMQGSLKNLLKIRFTAVFWFNRVLLKLHVKKIAASSNEGAKLYNRAESPWQLDLIMSKV